MTDLPGMQPPVSMPTANIPTVETSYRAPPTPLLQETPAPSNNDAAAAAAARVPNLQSNMFKMQRNKSM